ncbi:MAG: M12 family metallopeptidase [Pseudomonadota bacterium]|nr:M12 family metallopeptidase [Pseudomonadota bacterium]
MKAITCTEKQPTRAQLQYAIERAVELRPSNALVSRTVMRTPVNRVGGRARLTLKVGYRWPVTGVRLTVRFLDGPSSALQKRILLHMNVWGKSANVSFVSTRGDAQVRISRLDRPESMAGYWSYVGMQILGIQNQDEPTLNLEGFTMDVSEAEFKRVVRHEAGHTLGFEHEHMRKELVKRIDRNKAVRYFDLMQGWTARETMEQVLTPLSTRSIMGTSEADPVSIMCYHVPGAITKDGKAILGGRDINRKDYAFAGTVYPKKVSKPKTVR